MIGLRQGIAIVAALAVQITGVLGGHTYASHSANSRKASCHAHVSVITHGYGSPDDVAVKHSHILFGDIHAGLVASVSGGHKRVIARGLSVPEGIAFFSKQRIAVVEQGLNRIDTVDLKTGKRKILVQLRNTTGREGVDGISVFPGDLVVPDSPYGSVFRVHHGRFHLIASGLSRPTDAVSYRGGFAVADENANAIWYLRKGKVKQLATVNTPDDVAIAHKALFAVTLGDGALWEVRPHLVRIARFPNPQGLATLNERTLVVVDSDRNSLFRVRLSPQCFG